MGAGASSGVSSVSDLASSPEDEALRVYEAIDTGGDGKLQKAEIKAALEKRASSLNIQWSPELIDKAFDMFDMDKSGGLNTYEFLAMIQALEEKEPPKLLPVVELFRLMDLDNDGFIDEKEGTEVAAALGVNADEFWDVLMLSDNKKEKSHRRKLNFEEFTVAVKSVLLGYLGGKTGVVAKKVADNAKKKGEVDAVLRSTIEKLKKKGWGSKGKNAEDVEEVVNFVDLKQPSEEELDAQHNEYLESRKKAEEAAEQARLAAEASVQAKAKADAEAAAAAARAAEETAAAAKLAEEEANAKKPIWQKDDLGNWQKETTEEAEERWKKQQEEKKRAAEAVNPLSTNNGAMDEEIDKGLLLDAAGGDADRAAKIAQKIAEAKASIEAKMKKQEDDALKEAEEAKKAAAEAEAKAAKIAADRKKRTDAWMAEEKKKRATA